MSRSSSSSPRIPGSPHAPPGAGAAARASRWSRPFARHIDLRAYEGAKRLVEMGYGVGVNFAAALAREFADGRLCPLVVEDLVLSWPYCLIQREHVELSPVARKFRALLTVRHRDTNSALE